MISSLSHVAAALRAFERGEILVVVDDDDRENEGDLVLAAAHANPEKLAFIVRYTSGIVCAPMPRQIADRLRLDPMVSHNDAPHATAFTVSVDYRHGLTTGISAEERCNTVRALANTNAGAEDFVRPGHVFPLIAREGGVLMRSGHTEAAVDLCRLSSLPPIGVICELVNDDGTVMRGQQVDEFATRHGLTKISVAELIAWRQRNEKLVERIDEFSLSTPAGPARAVSYKTPFDPMHHLAVIWGDIRDGEDIPVRMHLESLIDDVFARTSPLDELMRRLTDTGRGVLVYLREGSVGVASDTHRQLRLGPNGDDHDTAAKRANNWREIGLGAQILNDLGLRSIHLLASKKRHYVGLEGFGIEITETELIDTN